MKSKSEWLARIIEKLFPDDSNFSNDIKKAKYYLRLYNIFPSAKMNEKGNYWIYNDLFRIYYFKADSWLKHNDFKNYWDAFIWKVQN